MIITKRKLAYLACIIIFLQLSLSIGYAESTSLNIQATSSSNVLKVSGAGFDAQNKVTLEMFNNTTKIHTFTENITTDTSGSFTSQVTVPSNITGKYNFTASTLSKTASLEYTVQKASKPKPIISATPNNSNIVKVSGTGFNASNTVTFDLWNSTAKEYSFPGNITTDLEGKFSIILIIPTSLKGVHYLTATTKTGFTYVQYTVPDLTGETGATGANGKAADNNYVYLATGLSVVSIFVSLYALIKKPPKLAQQPQQRPQKDQKKKKK